MIRVGVVGLRFGAQVHVPAFRADPRCVVTALAGRDAARTASVAREIGVPEAYADWRELLAEGPIDAVSIAVPPVDQPDIIVEAARLGKHVFCEKPLAATVSAAETACEAARKSGVRHAIDFIFPEIEAWLLTQTLLRDGAIGAPRHFAYTWRVETFASRTRARSWKNDPREGGGVVGNFLSHVIFNVEWLLGEVVGIDSLPDRREAPGIFSDCVVHVAGSIHGSISVSTDAYLGGGHQIEIFGESGTLVLRNSTSDHGEGFEVCLGSRLSGRLEIVSPAAPRTGADGRIAPAGRIVRRFIDGIDRDEPIRPNLEDAVRVQRWLARLNPL